MVYKVNTYTVGISPNIYKYSIKLYEVTTQTGYLPEIKII